MYEEAKDLERKAKEDNKKAATTAITAATITTRFWSIPPGDWPRPAPSLDGLLNALIIPLMHGSFHSFNFFFKFDPCSGLTLRILGNFLQGTLYLFFFLSWQQRQHQT